MFFSPAEEAIATVLCDQLLGRAGDRLVPVVPWIDARLAGQQTDGWRDGDMPGNGQAWRESLAVLDADARDRFGRGLADCAPSEQRAVIQAVQDLGSGDWHGLNAGHVWSLWTRYACTAFYAHPGGLGRDRVPGPAYPRGYKNAGLDGREPFEVADAGLGRDPVRGPVRGSS